ncbi:MAG TPA: hypothetical protein VFQ92_09055 [Blastocatellia bacterium]|nr:hypothetical protein [Blastocatellia bacterium]
MQKKSMKTILEKYGYFEDVFEFVRTEGGSLNEGGPVAEKVYVIYSPTGFRRMYDGANWETEFEEDLKNRIFESGS